MARKKQTDEDKAARLVEQIEAECGGPRFAAAGEKPKGPITDSLVDRILDLGKPAIKALLKKFFPLLP